MATLDQFMIDAMHEVDAMLPGTPPIAPEGSLASWDPPPWDFWSAYATDRDRLVQSAIAKQDFDAVERIMLLPPSRLKLG